MCDVCEKNDISVVAIKGENKILLVRKMCDVKSLENEVDKFFPGTISFFDKLFQAKKYIIHNPKMASAKFHNAICSMLQKADWNFCAMEIVGDKVIFRYAHGLGIVRDTHRLNKVVVVRSDGSKSFSHTY